MRVIGISGMNGSIDFKRRELPHLDERAYRIVQGLDSAAALVTDEGVVAAASEERFTGNKTTGDFPVNAIRYCLSTAGLTMADIDLVAHSFDYSGKDGEHLDGYARAVHEQVHSPGATRRLLEEYWPGARGPGGFVPVRHHLAHAASSYHLSGFEDSLVVVADGMGEAESTSVYSASGGKLDPVHSVPALHSLGTLYGVFTLYLGFVFAMDEYKVMGLAPYGDPRRYFDQMRELVRPTDDGGHVVPVLAENRTPLQRETHEGALAAIARRFGPPRAPGAPVTQHHMDVAAALQAVLENCVLHTLRHFQRATGHRNLCLAGGVALNCTANGLISRSRSFDGLFVQPASGDDGSALGAALLTHSLNSGVDIRTRMEMPYWGPGYTEEDHLRLLADAPEARTATYEEDELAHEVASRLVDGKIVAWFQGRMEFGPRALGNRSILADPRDPGMRDHLNAVVKQREGFRPFAPVVREEDAHEFFELVEDDERYSHMLFVVRTRPEWRDRLPAITHVDGTARVQVLRRRDNERLWNLLGAFGEATGVPVLLNTSFNLRGQPVVMSPDTALETYLGSRIDHLVLGRTLVGTADRPIQRDSSTDSAPSKEEVHA